MKLWLARHAQPLIASDICYGAADVAADELATQVAALELAGVLPAGIDMICSPLQRCHQLAQGVHALRPDISFTTDARLREMDFGRWEGCRWADIPESEYHAWTDCFASYRFGGNESVGEFMCRVAAAWDEIQATGRDAIWITHAGVCRAASLVASGVRQIEKARQWPHDAPAFGHWQVLQGDGVFGLKSQ